MLSKNFNKVLIVNSDNLKIFSKKIKYYKNKKIIQKFPKKIIFKNPLTLNELNNIINPGKDIIINNTERAYCYYPLMYFLSRRKNPQILVSNIGNVQGSMWYYWGKNINYYILLITKILPKKIAVILAYLKIFKKIDIRFTSNKKLYSNFYLNKKKNFPLPSIYKEIVLTKSNLFEKILNNKNNKEKYITLLDFEPDYNEMKEVTGTFKRNEIDKHFKNSITLLNKLKKEYKKKIVICIHPLYDLKKFSKIYKDFKVVKFRTKEFITKSFIVLFYDSSAIVGAIIQKKKIIALKANLYKNKKDASSIYTDLLPFKTLNISKDIKINKNKLIVDLNKKIPLYNRYLNKYGQQNQKENGNEKIIRIIKKKFFKNE